VNTEFLFVRLLDRVTSQAVLCCTVALMAVAAIAPFALALLGMM
jgi:hypothetical protein